MATLTIRHFNDIIDSFVRNVTTSEKAYYVFAGKPTPWTDESSPPDITGSIEDYQQSIYSDLMYGKLIKVDDVAYMITNLEWTTGTVYDHYDQTDPDLYDKNFYVVTDRREVYKCIYNGGGVASTVKPNLASVNGTFTTADGYVWKYMFKIEPNFDIKFSGSDYIPVTVNTDVVDASTNGTIDCVRINDGGRNYKTYSTGFLNNYVNNYVVQLPNTASPHNDFYTKSSIYLKTGLGAGQIREILSYDGLTRLVYVTEPFDAYVQIALQDVVNPQNILIGQTLSQRHEIIAFIYGSNYFNVGDTIVQSDTGATGKIITTNSSFVVVDKSSTNDYVIDMPFYVTTDNDSLKTGTVNITSNTKYVNAVSGTDFTGDYAVNDYIRVGTNANTNIRRIVDVNSTVITVNTAFSHTLSANVHYKVLSAAQPASITVANANGVVIETNLNAVTLSIANSAIPDRTFFIGEGIHLIDTDGNDQMANGVVSFANTSTLILTSVRGSFGSNLYVVGASSLQNSKVIMVKSDPTVTISNTNGDFINGRTIYFCTSSTMDAVANATLKSFYYTPNQLTEYVISPTITFDGDGEGATAYAVINSVANSISQIVMIDPGMNYNSANVIVSANTLHGTGAELTAIVSPVRGHGSDPVEELGARRVGIVVEFGTGLEEQYFLPTYGSYRKIGIIEDPLFSDVIVGVDSFDRGTATIANKNGYNFATEEIVVQTGSDAAAVVVSANSTVLKLKTVRGAFIANTADDDVRGLTSGATANVVEYDTSTFSIGANVVVVSESASGAEAEIVEVLDENNLRLTNVYGRFDANDTIIDQVSNVYANVTSIYVSNGQFLATATFGDRFNQTARITLNTSYGNWMNYEYINQAVTDASGYLLSSNSEIDLALDSSTGTFIRGDLINNAANTANGYVLFANSTHAKLTSVRGSFVISDTINNGSVTSSIANVYTVLTLFGVNGDHPFQTGTYEITGANSGAHGLCQLANTITYPDLVEESGTVTYIENVTPFTRSGDSRETIRLIVKF